MACTGDGGDHQLKEKDESWDIPRILPCKVGGVVRGWDSWAGELWKAFGRGEVGRP